MPRVSPHEGWQKYLEGWQLGAWLVLIAALSALLVVPRNVEPDLVPPPTVDRIEQRRELDVERERAARGRAALPLEVRSVGEAFRRLGQKSVQTEPPKPLRDQLRRLTRVAIERHGSEKLLELRAVQAELFVAAMTSEPDEARREEELRELGGRLYGAGSARGWFLPAAGSTAAPDELAAVFRVYWSETLGLGQSHPYGPTLNEWRVYYRFLLGRLTPNGPDRQGDVRRKLGYVAALAQHDQDYPAHLARGVLLYQAGSYAEAAAELQAHLQRHPDGRWTLRTRNYLAACGAALLE